MNGTTALGNWTGLFRSGEKVRLRFINGSGMTYFDVRIPGLKMTVVAADGQYVHPVTVDELSIAVAETYDVIVEPAGQEAFTIFAQDMGRTGYVSGTLATREGLRAPVPPVDPRPILSMADMGHGDMAHGGMAHADTKKGDMKHGDPEHAAARPVRSGARAAPGCVHHRQSNGNESRDGRSKACPPHGHCCRVVARSAPRGLRAGCLRARQMPAPVVIRGSLCPHPDTDRTGCN
jgi:FtsP/CotA-like multicopper oxidase with cupredoxin domain